MDLAPFPCGRLPGFHRASPSTPLDAHCYVAHTISVSRPGTAAERDGTDIVIDDREVPRNAGTVPVC